jgi:hypothetical protein
MKKHKGHFAPAQKGSSGSKAETLYVGGTPASYASPSTSSALTGYVYTT